MATNVAFVSPQTWRLAGALNALRREIGESRAIVEASVIARLDRDCKRLEQRHKGLVGDARRLTDGTQEERDALTQRIIQFYREVGELERVAASKFGGS